MNPKSGHSGYKKQIGAWGELQAEIYLKAQGLEIIEKNFRTRSGEVDIVAREGTELVFVEVKTRMNSENGYPEEAVTEEKLEHLTEAAETFLDKHPKESSWRVDVIAIIGTPGSKSIQFEWYKNVG
jgi:putative endonuclease